MACLLVQLDCCESDAWSQHGHPAIDSESVADDVARPRTAKPQNGRGNFVGSARTANGDVLRDFAVRLLAPGDDLASDLRVNESGIDRVHPDAVLDVFEGCCPREANDAVLRGDVRADARVARQRTDR